MALIKSVRGFTPEIGENCFLADNATIIGDVKIGNFTHIGIGSSVIQCLEIGKNSIIGAGSVVVKNIADFKKAYGNPCKEKGNIDE